MPPIETQVSVCRGKGVASRYAHQVQPMDWVGAVGGVVGVLVAIGALIVAIAANIRSSEANRISRKAFDRESLIDDRQREFRAVAWEASVDNDETTGSLAFELRNVGDTQAVAVTVVLHLFQDRETYKLGDIPARGAAKITSEGLIHWMRRARERDFFHPGFRVHWSSPLGQVSDEMIPSSSVDDIVDLIDDDY